MKTFKFSTNVVSFCFST